MLTDLLNTFVQISIIAFLINNFTISWSWSWTVAIHPQGEFSVGRFCFGQREQTINR